LNESVYGPSNGSGNDPSSIYLDYGNVLNCSLYVDNSTGWYELTETAEYTLHDDTGEIYIGLLGTIGANWTFYAYYNYSDALGNVYGIWCDDSSLTIFNNTIAENEKTGVYINNQSINTSPLKVDCNQIVSNLEDGIQVHGSNIIILNNTIVGNTGAGIKMWNSTGEIHNNTIQENNEPSGGGGGGGGGMSGIDMFGCNEVWVYNNNVSVNNVNIYINTSTNVTLEWNKILDANAVPYGWTGPLPRGIYSISSQMVASNNTIWGTILGIDIENANESTILRDNNIYGWNRSEPSTGPGYGVHLLNASVILEHNIFDGASIGIYCGQNSSAKIWNNTITNGTDGIYSVWSSPTIVGNNISGNGGWCIKFEYDNATNSGANGTGLTIDNMLSGTYGMGLVTQVWQLKIYVFDNYTSTGAPYELVWVNDTYNNPVWAGYTNESGYTETILVTQYDIIDSSTSYIYTPFMVYTTQSGTLVNIGGNTFVTVYIN
jgi:parallel beta-helix repeat protein